MRAMVLESVARPLVAKELAKPQIKDDEVLVQVHYCGVCRTDLHIRDGELGLAAFPLILGHQIVGRVAKIGSSITSFKIGDRVALGWLHDACGTCQFCHEKRENLCDAPHFTGYTSPGGFSEYCVAKEAFLLPLVLDMPDVHVAPLLCAGLIGYRAFKLVKHCKRVGFYGFGSSAHILVQIAKAQGIEIYAFTRPNDHEGQKFAKQMGAVWAGGTNEQPPILLDSAILFAPIGDHVPLALNVIQKGGSVICAGIHMSDIPTFPYSLLWNEKTICSIANLTYEDGVEFLKLAETIPLQTNIKEYPLEAANEALDDLKAGRIHGSAVLKI